MKIRHPIGAALTLIACVLAALFLIQVVHLHDYLGDFMLSKAAMMQKQQMMQQQQQQDQQLQQQ